MNWIKISDKLPEFNKTVILVKEGEEPKIGFLKSIDSQGNHFTQSNYNDMNTIFFGRCMKPEFIPEYWCEIEMPNFPQKE